METRDMPHGRLGFRFATALLQREFEKAHEMLDAKLKVEYPVPSLKTNFDEMMSLANPPGDLPEIEVMDNGHLGNACLDEKGWAYVAIWTEAVTVTVKPFGDEHLITELIWGRP